MDLVSRIAEGDGRVKDRNETDSLPWDFTGAGPCMRMKGVKLPFIPEEARLPPNNHVP